MLAAPRPPSQKRMYWKATLERDRRDGRSCDYPVSRKHCFASGGELRGQRAHNIAEQLSWI